MASTKSKQDALIDELLKECTDPKEILGKNGCKVKGTMVKY